MGSPFPGMDPHIEQPSLWPGFHAQVIGEMRALLVPQLRPRYFVDIEKRLYVCSVEDPAARGFVADVAILSARETLPAPAPEAARGPVVITMVDEIEISESRLVVYPAEGGTAVAVVELLSPANKTAGSRGRREYLEKRGEILRSDVHLVEVDLLRAGERIPSLQPLPRADYLVHVSRVGLRPRGEIWPIRLRDPLPVVPVPLSAGENDARLDLGAAVRLAYDRGGYDVRIDYRKPPPPPPLVDEDAAWARERAAAVQGG